MASLRASCWSTVVRLPRTIRRLLTLAVAVIAFGPSLASAQVWVEGIVAVVGEGAPGVDSNSRSASVILLSDVELRARMRLLRERPGRPHVGALPRGLLRATLTELVGETLIEREAIRVGMGRVSSDARAEALRALYDLAGGEESLRVLTRALEISDEEIRRIALRRARVAAFLQSNLGDETVTEEELRRVYDSAQHPFLGQSFEDARELLRVWLSRDRIARSIAAWVTSLAERSSIRYPTELRPEGVASDGSDLNAEE